MHLASSTKASAHRTQNIADLPLLVMDNANRVSDQLSDGLIFGRLFQANEKFSTFRSCVNL